jgi:hypothetical protein
MERKPMNARRFSAVLFGSVLAGASLFAQVPQLGTPTGWARVQKEENRALRQQQGISKNAADAQARAKVTRKDPAQLQFEQHAASRRIIRQKRDVRNVK